MGALEYTGMPVETAQAEEGYEYAVQWTHIESGEDVKDLSYWVSLETAQEVLESYDEDVEKIEDVGGKPFFTGRIVKRRKAGKVEEL